MRNRVLSFLISTLMAATGSAQSIPPNAAQQADAGQVTSHSQGLHGYIGFGHEKLPPESACTAGMGCTGVMELIPGSTSPEGNGSLRPC